MFSKELSRKKNIDFDYMCTYEKLCRCESCQEIKGNMYERIMIKRAAEERFVPAGNQTITRTSLGVTHPVPCLSFTGRIQTNLLITVRSLICLSSNCVRAMVVNC